MDQWGAKPVSRSGARVPAVTDRETDESTPSDDCTDQRPESEIPVSEADFFDAVEGLERPVVTAEQLARETGCSQAEAFEALSELVADGIVDRLDVSTDPVVWYPHDWAGLAKRERVVPFPERREIVVDQPEQFTRARLTQFAHLAEATRSGRYRYEVRREDVWNAPFDHLEDLLAIVRAVLPEPAPALADWIGDQWTRAHQFTLRTHEDGYVVLDAATPNLMGNVAREKLDDEHLRAAISETESWVAEESVAAVKRILYEAGYPVQDDRDLGTGEDIDFRLDLSLRDYQRHWVDEFEKLGSGVLVGPPGSGKTVAAMGIMERIGGETLILVPSRELASQWREALMDDATLSPDQIGEYHGGTKQVRPVTIATYQTAGMDRHRELFEQREWGLIVYEEVHHVPASINRRSTDLQTKHRLGLSATPVRGDDRETEIFTLIGPPIGTDWSGLFDAGFVQEPVVEIRYVPWASETDRSEYGDVDSREQRQVAAANPAKLDEIRYLLADNREDQVMIFVDYLEQGAEYAEGLGVPFISGETRHAQRERLLQEFRTGERRVLLISRVGDEGIDLPNADLAIVASGLGGSRRQGAQRAGRTMRPAGSSWMVLLATQGTVEEDFARRQTRHLAEKGIRIRETGVDTEVEDRDE
jgi:DNA excision repair protein ERCC-3